MITQIAGGIVLVDICDKLPRHKTKLYVNRTTDIKRVYIHHSGRLGAPGIDGPINSARYITTRKKNPFAGAPYHYWIPFEEVMTAYDYYDCYTIYRLQPDIVRCYHTGMAANSHGLGVVLQGNTTTNGITDYQIECLEALIPWLFDRYKLQLPDGLSYHAEADKYGGKKKAACPGKAAMEWINEYRLAA